MLQFKERSMIWSTNIWEVVCFIALTCTALVQGTNFPQDAFHDLYTGYCNFTIKQDASFLGPLQHKKVGATNFGYYQFGPFNQSIRNPPTLILIPGSGSTTSLWGPTLLRGLAQTRKLIVADNPGLGFSAAADNTSVLAIPGQAAAWAEFVKELDIPSPPSVLGMSLGGATGFELAAHNGSLFDKFVTAGGFADVNFPYPPFQPNELSADQRLEDIQTRLFPNTTSGLSGLCNFIQGMNSMPPDPATNQSTSLQFEGKRTWGGVDSLLGNITNPFLILQGNEDAMVPAWVAPPIAAKIPNASLIRFPDAGHGLLFQKTNEALVFINDFLDYD